MISKLHFLYFLSLNSVAKYFVNVQPSELSKGNLGVASRYTINYNIYTVQVNSIRNGTARSTFLLNKPNIGPQQNVSTQISTGHKA